MLLRKLRLIDGAGAVHEGVDIRIREGRFIEIGPVLASGGPELDTDGCTAIPGLIDAHTHLSLDATPQAFEHAQGWSHSYQALGAARRAEELLTNGVTTARDVGGVASLIFGLRDGISDGLTAGPRIFAAGAWLTATGGHGWPIGVEADGSDEVRRAVREQLKAGSDLIKLMASGGVIGPGLGPNAVQFSEEEVAIAATEAHGAAKTVAAHAHGADSIRNAVRGGVDTIEHGSFLTPKLIEEMREQGTFLVPTLAVVPLVLGHAEEAGIEAHTVERGHEVAEVQRKNVAAAHRAGVSIVAGTDMGTPFTTPDTIHAEIGALAGIGLTHHEAIQAATFQGARSLGLDNDLGTVQPGRRADLLVLDGDPLADLSATRRIRHLLQDGQLRIRDGVRVRD